MSDGVVTQKSGSLAIGSRRRISPLSISLEKTHGHKCMGEYDADAQENPWRGRKQARQLVMRCTEPLRVAKDETRVGAGDSGVISFCSEAQCKGTHL